MTLRRCSPKNAIAEPRLLPQWWIYYDDFVERSAAGVHGRELKLIPERADATSFSWMGNIRGWCISGQFWIGHRIPAYANS
jgi:valyl-tRNA synthetase